MRRRSASLPARLRELDEKPGMGDEHWRLAKSFAEGIMDFVDGVPAEWRALINEFTPSSVFELMLAGCPAARARRILEARERA
jgi:hypothetical protein